MSAEAIGRHMPVVITLDDLAAMNDADQHSGRRYETSTDGTLTAIPLPDSGHAMLVSELMSWLLLAAWPADQVIHAAGVRIPAAGEDGGRMPDITVWARPQPPADWSEPSDLLLVIEVLSRGSEANDLFTKVTEFAGAGIPRYWTVARDDDNTVTLRDLNRDGRYATRSRLPIAQVLSVKPEEVLGSAGR